MPTMNSMPRILIILLLLSIECSSTVPWTDVTYEELEELDAICDNLDTCKIPRAKDDDSLMTHTCHCSSLCSKLDTCCVDSPFRNNRPNTPSPSCRHAFGEEILQFIVDTCPAGTPDDLNQRCSTEWNKIDDDIRPHIPVTSLPSEMHYKNYFCFKCNEDHDKYLYWNIKLAWNDEYDGRNQTKIVPSYIKESSTWVAALGKEGALINITLKSVIPEDVKNLSKTCLPNVISNCYESWEDPEIEGKCKAYTSFVSFTRNGTSLTYKNPHCALCNDENLENMGCAISDERTGKKPFSFSLLIDINKSDGDKVGKIEKCDSNSTWDPYFEKCRTLKCALPGKVVVNGKCTDEK